MMEYTDAPHLRGVLREIAAVFGTRVLEEGATVRVSWGPHGPDVSVALVSDAGGGAQDVHRRCADAETVGAREVARAGGRRCGAWSAPLETKAGVREVARARQTLPVQQHYGQHHGQHGWLPAMPQKLRRDVVFVARSRFRTEATRAVQRTWRRACQVTRLRHVRLVALGLQAQWRRRAATRFVVAVRRQQENTAQDTPSILLEDAEMCHVRLVARAGAARAVQRSWRRVQQALEMQAQAQVQAQVDNNYKSKTRTKFRSAEPQN